MKNLKLNKFTFCPKCGSVYYSIDYESDGRAICWQCKGKMETIMVKPLKLGADIPENCSFCGKEGSEDDHVPCHVSGVTVFKCKGCGKFDGFFSEEEFMDDVNEASSYQLDDEPDNRQYKNKEVKIAEKEGKHIISATASSEIAKAIKKHEKDPKEKNKKRLHTLVAEKRELLQKNGINTKEAIAAVSMVKLFLEKEGVRTDKQLMNLFFAALYADQEEKDSNITSKLTERLMQEKFGIDRKTLRKWKKVFKNKQ